MRKTWLDLNTLDIIPKMIKEKKEPFTEMLSESQTQFYIMQKV